MTVHLIENFRALFYAPFYAAFELGAFKAEGVDVELKSPSAFGNSLAALAAGEAEVTWGGPMRLMLARDKDPGAAGVAFCEVVGRDPFYLIGRTPNPAFQVRDLLSVKLATVSEVPTPWICLQQDLRLAGADPNSVSRVADQSMAANAEALERGAVDVIQVFQPFARMLIDEGAGHLWYSAASRGPTCYTTLNTTRGFIERNPDTMLRMTRAIYRVQKWIRDHDGAELARVVKPYLREVPDDVLASCCNEYTRNQVWSSSPLVQREGLTWKRDAMLGCGAIGQRLSYEDYVDARFAQRAIAEDPPTI
ncbi:MAG TPA: ABC transporter substrate-binding protein [Burkholderiales bacterium]|nr:ABC transporter substrate-binding protein [Burkholderiales bacterium]